MNSSPPFVRVLLAGPVMFLTLSAIFAMSTIANANNQPVSNYVELALLRSDDAMEAGAFELVLAVNLEAEVGVTSVSVTTGGGTVWAMNPDGSEHWRDEKQADLPTLLAEADGTWTIQVNGSSPSTTTFTVSVADYVDGDLFASPTGLTPVHGASGVSPSTSVSWNDPTGASTPEALFVSIEDPSDLQDDNSVLGTLLITDTSWTAPSDLGPGENQFEVAYANTAGSDIGPMNVTSGSIIWNSHPLAPIGYPADRTLLFYGSYTLVVFTVPCLVDIVVNGSVDVNDLLAVLANWGSCPGCPEDIDGNDFVNIQDLLSLLANWGPCP